MIDIDNINLDIDIKRKILITSEPWIYCMIDACIQSGESLSIVSAMESSSGKPNSAANIVLVMMIGVVC